MAAELRHFAASDPIPLVVKGLEEDGAIMIDGLLDAEQLARLDSEVSHHVEAANPGMKHLNPLVAGFFGERTRHVAALASKSTTFVSDVMCHPLMLGVCDQILLPSCASYILNLGHIIDRGPGAVAQLVHRDEQVWIHVPRPAPTLQVASMIALHDFTRDNGPTRIVPGSHRWPVDREVREEEFAEAVMPAGSAVLYLGSTLHGAGTNRTEDVWRRGLHMSYLVGWLRSEENNVLATPPDIARTLPSRARALLGYAVHDAIEDFGGYAGMVELRDPMELLEEGKL